MKNFKKCISAILIFFCLTNVFSQPAEQIVKLLSLRIMKIGYIKWEKKVNFSISILQFGNKLKNIPIKYEVGPEKMDAVKKDSLNLGNGVLEIDGGTMKTPGFLRCVVTAVVDGKQYRNLATAAFEPQSITPAMEPPADFTAFWEKAKADLSKIPIDARVTLIPERCTEKTNVYHVNLQNYSYGVRLYGILCVPKKEGKYPAILRVPGAGVRPYAGDLSMAEKGIITFEIGIHGIPVNLEPELYTNLLSGALNGYWNYNLDDKDRFYYKRVYLGCIRANDFLFSLPQFDGSNLAVAGGSQGGALAIVTASIDTRVKFLAAFYPALSDMAGYLKGRAGGWPHLFNKNNLAFNNKKEKIETTGYYDVVNFARLIKIPGMYSWGFNDEVCPPTSMYAVYNVINAPKNLFLALETGHWTFPEQNEKVNNWLVEKLKGF